MQLDGRFKPPSGLGLSITGGGFSGGGFLDRDPANGEYAGALELAFQEVIQVKAFGVLNTRMPDGAEAFSLAVVISAEFTPIQFSFGFTLMGVGGLLGSIEPRSTTSCAWEFATARWNRSCSHATWSPMRRASSTT